MGRGETGTRTLSRKGRRKVETGLRGKGVEPPEEEQPGRAIDLSPNRFESLFVLLGFEEKRQRTGVPSGGSATARAPGTRAADRPRRLTAAREDTGADRHIDGAPPPWARRRRIGKPRNPQVPVGTRLAPGPRPPLPSTAGHGAPLPAGARGVSKIPGREVTSKWGDAIRPGRPRARRLP